MREILLQNANALGSTQLRVRETPDGIGGTDYSLIGLFNDGHHRIGNAYANTGVDSWEVPTPIVDTPYEDLDFSPPGGFEQHWVPWSPAEAEDAGDLAGRSARITGSGNNQVLRFSSEDRNQNGTIYGTDHWYRSDGGWTSGDSHRIRSEAFRVLNPCNDWTINLVAQARSHNGLQQFGNTTPQPPGTGPIQRGGIGIGPVTIYLLLQKVYGQPYQANGQWTVDQAWFAGGAVQVPFACTPVAAFGDYFGMNTENMIPLVAPALLEATIAYAAATRTLSWSFGKFGEAAFNSANATGQYTDEFGFAGYCDGCEVSRNAINQGPFDPFTAFYYTFRSLSIS